MDRLREWIKTLVEIQTDSKVLFLSLRNSLGLSQTEFGVRLGVSREFISRIERGRDVPSFKLLSRLLEEYNALYRKDSEILGRDT